MVTIEPPERDSAPTGEVVQLLERRVTDQVRPQPATGGPGREIDQHGHGMGIIHNHSRRAHCRAGSCCGVTIASVTPEAPLLSARAAVLHDLTVRGLADARAVSLLEEALASRRWWLNQWAEGAAYVPGLVAQDVQDALYDDSCRWPRCTSCDRPVEHSLQIQPELGDDPRWICDESGLVVAPLGQLP